MWIHSLYCLVVLSI